MATNCLIFGTGRSGTTALTGCLAASGAFIGHKLTPATPNMPDGFCEDENVYWWNRRLLEQLHAKAEWRLPDEPAMREMLTHTPYALKDPSFSWTYPAWKPILVEPYVCIVLFRDPVSFAESALRLRADVDTITDDREQLLKAWAGTLENIFAMDDGTFRYVHYRTLIDGSIFPWLEQALGYPIKHDFVRQELVHNKEQECPEAQLPVYRKVTEKMVLAAGIPPATSGSEDRRSGN